jgi:hypothetical protein
VIFIGYWPSSVSDYRQLLRLHQSVVLISYWPLSVSGLGQSFASASQYSPSISGSHEIFNLCQSDPISINDFYQSIAFVYQQPSLVIGFHHLSVAFTKYWFSAAFVSY